MHTTLEYKEGYEAFENGDPLEWNPYDEFVDAIEFDEWNLGWNDAKKDNE